jgi:hypothetical protein
MADESPVLETVTIVEGHLVKEVLRRGEGEE